MKPIKIILFLVTVCISNQCTSQLFSVVKATQQNWAGGVAGHYGTNYYIELITTSHTASPDTVWIDGNTYPLNFKTKGGDIIRTVDSVNHQVKYIISISASHSEFNKSLYPKNDTTSVKQKPTRDFKGAAMISYTLKHKQHFFIVKSFASLPQLNYP